MRRWLAVVAALVALAAVPAAAGAALPPGFIGVSPQSPSNQRDFTLMRKAGVDNVRLPLNWAGVEPTATISADPDFSGFDNEVQLAAEQGIRIMPFVAGTPSWVAVDPLDLPVRTSFQRYAWTRFLRDLAGRYGPAGTFWDEHTNVGYFPITHWEIWNEENIVSYANDPNPAEYARLIRISGRTLHRAAPGSQVLIGGFFGRPLQVPPNVATGDYLQRIYAAGNVKPYFDGVGLHPYVAVAKAMGGQIRNLRRIMASHGDSRTEIYITELGWGSEGGPTRWQRGLRGQAQELSQSFEMLSANRRRWRIGGAWWFTWTDEGGTCVFCRSAGLLTSDRRAKPSWYRFNLWTGGDPGIVPRIGAGDDAGESTEAEAEPETEIRGRSARSFPRVALG